MAGGLITPPDPGSASLGGMHASARLRLPTGDVVELVPGDLIGRTAGAALSLDDPRISEAHALLSLRGGALHLLSLRRMIAVNGKPVSSVELRRGLVVALADDLTLTVEALHLPGHLPAIEVPGLGRRLLGTVASLRAGGPPQLAGRYEPDADAHLWLTDEEWRLQTPGEPPRTLAPDDTFRLGGATVRFVGVPLAAAGQTPTRVEGGVQSPLRLITRYDTAHIHRDGRPPLVVSGRGARILSELASFGGPVSWQMLAAEVWPDHPSPEVLRHRLDVNLTRLRARLRAADVRSDLVRSDGSGQVELLLYEGDSVEEQG